MNKQEKNNKRLLDFCATRLTLLTPAEAAMYRSLCDYHARKGGLSAGQGKLLYSLATRLDKREVGRQPQKPGKLPHKFTAGQQFNSRAYGQLRVLSVDAVRIHLRSSLQGIISQGYRSVEENIKAGLWKPLKVPVKENT
jgi:hypothetical protein